MRLVGGSTLAAVERACTDPEAWVPVPVTAAEQGPPPVWALITFRVKGESWAVINSKCQQ